MRRGRAAKAKNGNGGDLGFEATLWQAADALHGRMDAVEYTHVVLGPIALNDLRAYIVRADSPFNISA